MKKTTTYIVLALMIVFSFIACNKEKEPFLVEEGTPGPDPDTTKKVRKILFEKFTGHTCVNCPGGAAQAQDLKNQYGEQLILLSVHAGSFADPASAPYTADYRTQAGNDLNAFYNVQFYPSAIINRTKYNGMFPLFSGFWQDAIEALVNLPPEAHIKIDLDFDSGTRKLTGNVEVEFLSDFSCDYNICFYLLESGIISAQKNDDANIGPTPDILDYEHKHMLRDAAFGAWGTELTTGGVSAGQTTTADFTLNLDLGWNENNCDVVVFVYNATTREIIQAEEKSVL